jgi:hypothetical protein
VTTTTLGPDLPITELTAMPDEELGIDWLRVALRQAMALELSTIPLYSCGLWSIVDPVADRRTHRTIREIIFDEMSHFALVGNMLAAIGGTPQPTRIVPTYPGPLPGGVRPELEVRLGGLTRASLDMYSRIEEPDEPIVTAADAEQYTSIGAFLRKVRRVFQRIDPREIRPVRQLERDMTRHGAGNSIVPMTDLGTVLRSIDIIAEQGEGTTTSPENPHYLDRGELSHYYCFRELYHGRRLVRGADGTWSFTGDRIAMPATFAVADVPAGGWAKDPHNAPANPSVAAALHGFNLAYSDMLRELEAAWATDDRMQRILRVETSIRHMAVMRERARLVMSLPLPDGTGWRYCPEFLFVPPT